MMDRSAIVIHVPHASTFIPDPERAFFGGSRPMRFYQKNKRVYSIMIEINRGLYMNVDGSRNERFPSIRTDVQALLKIFSEVIGQKTLMFRFMGQMMCENRVEERK